MTQNRDESEKIAQLGSLFSSLDDRGQDSALAILRSLQFAQSFSCVPADPSSRQPFTCGR